MSHCVYPTSVMCVDCFCRFTKCGIQTGLLTEMLKYCRNPGAGPPGCSGLAVNAQSKRRHLSPEALAHFVENREQLKTYWDFLCESCSCGRTFQPRRNNACTHFAPNPATAPLLY